MSQLDHYFVACLGYSDCMECGKLPWEHPARPAVSSDPLPEGERP